MDKYKDWKEIHQNINNDYAWCNGVMDNLFLSSCVPVFSDFLQWDFITFIMENKH